MNITKKDKIILFVLAGVLILVCYLELFLIPMMDKVFQVKQEISDMNTRLDSITVSNSRYTSNKKTKEDLDNQVADASEALPFIVKEPEITYDLKKQSDSASIKVNSVSFSTPVEFDSQTITKPGEKVKIAKFKIPQGKLMTMPASISCRGSYSAILNFIQNIEKDKRIAEVQTANISGSGKNDLQISLNVDYYYLDKEEKSDISYSFVGNSSSYGNSDMFGK